MRSAAASIAGALLLVALPFTSPAEAKVAQCTTPHALYELDRPLPRTEARLRNHEELRIVALGSSSTAGYGASSPARTYPSRLAAELTQLLPRDTVHVVNKGVGGETSVEMVKRFDKDVFSEQPDLVIWQVGTNAVIQDKAVPAYGEVVRDGIERLRAAGIDVLIMDLQYAPKVLRHPQAFDMQKELANVARDERVPLFHRFDIMEHWLASQQLTFKKMLSADGLHMNDLSYACLGRLVAQSIVERATANAAVASRR
jgi:lysophospholipase L1-like esterase